MRKYLFALLVLLPALAFAATLEFTCPGMFKATADGMGYMCDDGAPAPLPPVVGVEMRADATVNVIITRRKTDVSKAVRIELPASTAFKINGVSK